MPLLLGLHEHKEDQSQGLFKMSSATTPMPVALLALAPWALK